MDKKRLTAADLAPITSAYLTEGRKQESWKIEWVDVSGEQLWAKIVMHERYQSPTDRAGFHLTIFSTLEFLSQLMIVYAHHWACIEAKVREGWMVESHTRSVRALRNPDDIRVSMSVQRMRRRGERLYCVADFTVTDETGGLFEVTLKGFLS